MNSLELTPIPLGKKIKTLWDDGKQLGHLDAHFQWLLKSPGIGILTGEAGVGKTAALRQITRSLNPHRYKLIYMPETDFGRLDLYRQLAMGLGLEPSYRRSQIWREVKTEISVLYEKKNVLPIWIIDEAQNLPKEFFLDLPSFLNFALDSKDMLTVWLVGHPCLTQLLDRAPYAALLSRVMVKAQIHPIIERERFCALIEHAFKEAGHSSRLISDSGVEILRQASQGKPRSVSRILGLALQIAAQKGMSHLPDEVLTASIGELK